MEVTGLHDLLPDRLSGSSFKEDIIRKDDGCLPTGLEDSMNVLQEVELLVTGRDPEVLPVIGQVVLLLFSFLVREGHGALFPKRRVREDVIIPVTGKLVYENTEGKQAGYLTIRAGTF